MDEAQRQDAAAKRNGGVGPAERPVAAELDTAAQEGAERSRFPALISATGRCFAAFNGLTEGALRDAFARLKWDHPPEFETRCVEVEETRVRGYAIDRGAYILA